jgi:N-acetyl-anhydromuramyl-L-alanine amidase AmpD
MVTYGLPAGANITYGSPGFPAWVYQLGAAFNLQASTYPGHQESERAEAGFTPNPQHLNRGIDWTGTVPNMQRFAEYLLGVKGALEQVIWQNPNTGQRVGVAGGDDVTNTPYYQQDFGDHTDHVHTRQAAPIPMPGGSTMPAEAPRPDFNEYPVWSPSNQDRGGTKIDLFLLHTQEGPGNADSLAQFLGNPANSVSYHYTVSEDPNDHGVTVCDVVDTDLASWSVLSANNRSINLCFAGSSANWTRTQWLAQSRAIDVAAYLAVQDCRKYGIPLTVIAPPYTAGRAGISDHNYVTKVLGDGTHTDVGPHFPWDVFAARVAFWANPAAPAPAPKPAPAPAPTPIPAPVPVPAAKDRTELEWLAFLGDQPSLTRVLTLARGGDTRALLVLARIEAANPAALQTFVVNAKG